MDNMKIYLIDGTYELFRAHFAQPPRLAPDGMPVSAIRGFIQSILALISSQSVTHIAVAFDSDIPSFRNEIFPFYKDGSNTPEDLKSQFSLAERAVEALGITCWPMREYEADDILASAAEQFSQDSRVSQVVVCSPDKDLCQIVKGDEIVCLLRKDNFILNQIEVENKYGFAPSSIPDYLALVGDTADGIPGIPRWGSKSTSTLIGRYTTIDEIPVDHRLWDVNVRGAASLSKSLEESRDKAYLFKKLATLVRNIRIDESTDDLEWLGADPLLFPKLCNELDIASLVNSCRKWKQQ
jgi:5'-3' exonuclease